jgi:ribosomal 50S subunit-recycling heat shock protein
MKKITKYWIGLACGAALFVGQGAFAADAKDYQVTGPVLEVTSTTITVQKGNDKWEIARNGSTKVTGEIKVGAKVTIHYTMVASDIEVKSSKSKKTAASTSSTTSKKTLASLRHARVAGP